MSIYQTDIAAGPLALPQPGFLSQRRVQTVAGLDAVFASAPRIAFDDSSRFVFLSDCHRGDNSRADAFSPNEELYLAALGRYRKRGFTYVEVGDGDDLWLNRRLESVRAAHPRVFDLLHDLDHDGRLHLIRGNHELDGRAAATKDGLAVHEGLVLTHIHTNQRIFVVHGHQVDPPCAALSTVSRFMVTNFWAHVVRSPLGSHLRPTGTGQAPDGTLGTLIQWLQMLRRGIADRLAGWAQEQRITTICAHTHRPVCANYGQAPYFNTGSCIAPGYITGIEIERGVISLVKWSASSLRAAGESLRIERQLLAAPRALCLFP